MSNFILWLAVGGFIGWVVSLLMGADARPGVLRNIIAGVSGAFVAGLLLSAIFGIGTVNKDNFSFLGLMTSLFGSLILLVMANLFPRGRVR
jgi:uncharacterized membrane protein YeaQ/YmgE (transglycosylase-associated protein family)